MRSALALAHLALLAACGGSSPSDAGPDAGDAAVGDAGDASVDAGPPDMRAPTPFTLHATSASGTITVASDPLVVSLTAADGTAVVSSPAAGGALGFATDPTGDARYHEPTTSRTVSPLDFGITKTDDTHGVIGDAAGRTADVVLEAPAPGVFHLTLTKQARVTDVSMSRLTLADDGSVFDGLGERHEGASARGRVVPMQFQLGGADSGFNEHHVPVPFLAASKGWGVFAQTREAGAFDVASTDPAAIKATFEGGVLDLWFFVDADPNRVVALYTQHTGLPILPPRWAFAPMQWRNEWTTGDQLRGDMDAMRTLRIPNTCMWIDNPWQTSYNDLNFDETRFPMHQALLDEMRSKGFVPLVWSTPYLDAVDPGASPTNMAETLFLMAQTNGWLVTLGGSTYVSPAAPGAHGGILDFTQHDALAFWQARIEGVVDQGVRAFKLDYGEDILPSLGGVRAGFSFSDGTTARQTHGLYNTLYHTPYRRALDGHAGADGGFLLVRASAWGGQTVADVIWPGDLDNDFTVGDATHVGGLPSAISAGVSLAQSGFPHFGSDTGGFRGGMPTREALLRWAEFNAFMPILQLGGAGDSHNPWLYDAAAGDLYKTLARAHMDLVPYLRVLALAAHTGGSPTVRDLSFEFPADAHANDDPYSYMLGPDILVAPVWQTAQTTRTLHLPPGHWVHWFSGTAYDGGATAITVPAPLGTTPAFVRQGALIPMLAGDVDTLVTVDAASGLVDDGDRPFLRAWIVPGETRDVSTEEGLDLHVEHPDASVTLVVTPRAGGAVHDLRARIDLANAAHPIASVTSVTAGGGAVTASADAATVQAGCDGACWFQEGATLWLSVRSATATTVAVR